jgi:2-oxoisovalerate dehydrogenase E1 component beta subunit
MAPFKDLVPSVLRRGYATASATTTTRRLNVPIDFSRTSLLHHTAESAAANLDLPKGSSTTRLNLFQAVNAGLRTALKEDTKVLCFGEDVGFGGVFRCTMGLQDEFGPDRVFNTPIVEQGIVGMAIGAAAEGRKPIVEIQFGDYVWPAFDQIINEASKFRYREGSTGGNVGGMVIRMPSGGVGHGALYVETLRVKHVTYFASFAHLLTRLNRYHSQSPESLFCHVPGFKVVVPRSPIRAKGLLLASVLECQDPVLFLEPKILYRAAAEEVPDGPYTLPIGKAEVLKEGKDLTIISYGRPLYTCEAAIQAAESDFSGISIELIDLQTIYPWDRKTIAESVKKTGRAMVVHESMVNYGVGAEVAATIQEKAFLHLQAPVMRVAGLTTHTGLIWEKYAIPDIASKLAYNTMLEHGWSILMTSTGIYDGIKRTLEY